VSEGFSGRYGPWAVVLGAGQGIGRAFARELAGRGLDLLLIDLREDLLTEAVEEARARGRTARSVQVDLGAPGAGAHLRAAVSGLDLGLVVYTAMLSRVGPFLEDDLATHLRVLGVGCAGPLATARVLGEGLCRRGRGGMILTSSLAGFQGTGWVAGYSACKAYDLALAEALWWEWKPLGVDVLALAPGSTDTPGFLAHQPRIERAALQSAEAVAREALDALGHQPLLVPGAANRQIREALEKLPRQQRVEVMGEQTRAQFRSGS